MKNSVLVAIFLFAASSAWSQTVRDGSFTTIFTNQTLTTSYVSGTIQLDLKSYDSVVLEADVGNAVAGRSVTIKYQWCLDNTITTPIWIDEPALSAGSASGTTGEVPYTPYSRVISLTATNTALPYIERERRLSRFFRVQVKADSATTATLSIKAVPMNNAN